MCLKDSKSASKNWMWKKRMMTMPFFFLFPLTLPVLSVSIYPSPSPSFSFHLSLSPSLSPFPPAPNNTHLFAFFLTLLLILWWFCASSRLDLAYNMTDQVEAVNKQLNYLDFGQVCQSLRYKISNGNRFLSSFIVSIPLQHILWMWFIFKGIQKLQ